MGKILLRCDVCGNFHAGYLVKDELGQPQRLCYSCWMARTRRELAARDKKATSEPSPESPPPAEKDNP